MKNNINFEDEMIVISQWDEKDTDLVVEYKIDKKLKLESVPELSQ